jgi:hypothetical protein
MDITSTAAPTLTDLLAARVEEIAENERENARRAQLSREADRDEALAFAYGFMQAHVSPTLAEVLRMTPAVDDNMLDLDADDDRYHDHAGYLMLDLSGAGVDDDNDARRDPALAQRDERWSLAHTWAKYQGYGWTLRGPHGYSAQVGAPYSTDENLDRGILDAIGAYPAWLASADERRAAQLDAEREAEQRRSQRPQPPHLEAIEGPGGMLTRGAHLLVRVRNPRSEDGIMEWTATLEAYNDCWLLLTLDDTHTQRLVPLANVQDIRPLAPLPAEAE